MTDVLVSLVKLSSDECNCILLPPYGVTRPQWVNRILDIIIQENAFDNEVCQVSAILSGLQCINTLRPWQNGRHFAGNFFKCIFLNQNVRIPIKMSLKFVLKGSVNNIPALVQIMAWSRSGDKPSTEPVMVSLPSHICDLTHWGLTNQHLSTHAMEIGIQCFWGSPPHQALAHGRFKFNFRYR